MLLKLALAWMCALVLVSAAPCRHFICKDPVDPQNPEVCAEIVKKSPSQWLEYVGKCDKGYICRMSETDDLTMKCLTNPEYQKLPGQKCTDASLCQGKVENGYCRGKKEGETCEHHLNCDVGLRCGTELKCEQASVEGEFCDSDTKLCQSYLYCKEGVCTKFGSVANDAPPGKGGEELCVSHHTDKNGVCREGPTLIGPNIVDSNDNKCVYSDAEENYATCGFHSEGKAICRPGDGEMMSEWKNLLSYLDQKPKCHSLLAYMAQCDYAAETVGRRVYMKARLDYYKLEYYTQLQGVPDCVQKFSYPEYFELLNEYSGAGTVSAVLAVFIALLVALL